MVDAVPPASRLRAVAFHLPQFHPCPENDAFWGAGFTEWRNVVRARPRFRGHLQPHLPADLGFYDLRLAEARTAQAELARAYGIHGFCYYHYWFSGKKMLHAPIDSYADNNNIRLKYMLCWANENWTRSWDGLNKNVLLEQKYEKGWEEEYARDVSKYLSSERYYKRGGKPVLQIYNVSAIPDCRKRIQNMRKVFHGLGVDEVEILAVLFYGGEKDADKYGVEGFSEFPPHRMRFIGASGYELRDIEERFSGNIFSYGSVVTNKIAEINAEHVTDTELGVMCGWDNTARRRSSADIFHGSTPAVFREWFKAAYTASEKRASKNKNSIVFVNAWNEWAEGTYLEPDMKYGRGYLEAIRSVTLENR